MMTEFNSAFIDTSPFIYFIERSDAYFDRMKLWFSEAYGQGKLLVTSPVTVEEYSSFHFRSKKFEYIHAFRAFVSDMEISVRNIDFSIGLLAAELRAKYSGIKAMDALQLASAIQNHCEVFLTNDKQLRQVEEIKVLLVEEL